MARHRGKINATIVERIDLTSVHAIFRVRLDQPFGRRGESDRAFLPGQYVSVGVPSEEGLVERPFSIASAPEDRRGLEFLVRLVEQPVSARPFTPLLFGLGTGDRLHVRPVAVGRFTLAHTVGEENRGLKLFVASGTGVAPFVSMIRSRSFTPGASMKDFVLLHGVRTPASLAYRDELVAFARAHGLRYLPTISRPSDPESTGWEGSRGRVDALLAPDRIADTEAELGLSVSPDHASVFVCGLKGTIAATIEHLLARGYVPPHRRLRRILGITEEEASTLFYEQYDSDPLFDLRDPSVVARLRAA